MKQQRANILKDLVIILISIIIAVILYKTKLLENLITSTKEMRLLGSLIAGMFFTSVFTTALATVVLAEIAQANSIFLVAIVGGFCALLGDYVIFHFVKNSLSKDLMYLLKQTKQERFISIFRLKFFRWLIALLGAIVIASPLPDELGLAMLGFSKMKTSLFIPISFIFNSLGILIIGFIAKAIK